MGGPAIRPTPHTSRRSPARAGARLWTRMLIAFGAVLLLWLAGACAERTAGEREAAPSGTEEPDAAASGGDTTITLASAEWSSAIASSNLIKAVLAERLGYRTELQYYPADRMWQAVAEGAADATVSAWLPVTHAAYREQFGEELSDLGPNLDGVRTGLVVPRVSVGRQTDASGARPKPYIPVTSIPGLAGYAEQFDGRIVGIEPSAGIMRRTREALRAYDLEDSYRLVAGSETEMLAALERAIQTQSWVVVTGWTPHWAFGQWDLAFLDDPKNVYGSEERIHTVVSPDLEAEHPAVYTVLDRFRWTLKEAGQLMLWIHRDEGVDPYGKALRWVRTHSERVEGWLPAELR